MYSVLQIFNIAHEKQFEKRKGNPFEMGSII